MKVYNTLSRKKETFKPRSGKKVQMFVCGITPYDSPHIGNVRSLLNYDILARYLRFLGFKLFYLQNITDIDDKIIKKMQDTGMLWQDVADKYFKELEDSLNKLNIKSVDKYAKATEHIDDIIKQIQKLIKKGYAYESNGSVFFDITKFKDYGKLSKQKLSSLKKAERTEEDKDKRHPYDFVLWKAKKENEPSWDAPFGAGRPGWHIEDTAITEHFFGTQYDIHGGGLDLIFPHHECEIAQQEAASGKKPFVKYWMHSGFITFEGEKMSKSLGNVILAKDVLEKTGGEIIRFALASLHYRSPADFSEKLLDQTKRSLETIRTFLERLKSYHIKTKDAKECKILKGYIKKFYTELDDDLNTPKALAGLFSAIKRANFKMDKGTFSQKDKKNIEKFLKDFENIFGIEVSKKDGVVPEDIMDLLKARERFRKEKRWNEADMARDAIEKRGYKIEDTPKGPKVKKA